MRTYKPGLHARSPEARGTASTSCARALSSSAPSPTPAHRIWALLAEGNAPKTASRLRRARDPRRAARAPLQPGSGLPSDTSPRNFRVRWTFSGLVHRTRPLTESRRAHAGTSSRTSGGGKTATKARTGPLGKAARSQLGGAVGYRAAVARRRYRYPRSRPRGPESSSGAYPGWRRYRHPQAVAGRGREAHDRHGDQA